MTTSFSINYPDGCKEVSDDLSEEELHRRLKALSKALYDLNTEDDEQQTHDSNNFNGLAEHLSSEFYISHRSKDIRVFIACCISDILRLSAPNNPFQDPQVIMDVFGFFVKELKNLADTNGPNFKRYFYLLQELTWSGAMNILHEYDGCVTIFCNLFKFIFQCISGQNNKQLYDLFVELIAGILNEFDTAPSEIIDIILTRLVEPNKSNAPQSYNLAKNVVTKCEDIMSKSLVHYFTNIILMGKNANLEIGEKYYEAFYQLFTISPNVIQLALSQFEFKLKSTDDSERKKATQLLLRIFSSTTFDETEHHKSLWFTLLGRFNDKEVAIRKLCAQFAQEFILNRPDLCEEITDHLRQRVFDTEESVRYETVNAIISAGRKDITKVNDELLNLVKDRTLDKKLKIRSLAINGLARLYNSAWQRSNADEIIRLSWIKERILYSYYQQQNDDKMLVERALLGHLVPYNLEIIEKARRLYILYGSIDQTAIKAINEIFRMQKKFRDATTQILEFMKNGMKSERIQHEVNSRLQTLSNFLPDPSKSFEYLKKFIKMVEGDSRLKVCLQRLLSPDCPCMKSEELTKEILKKMGNAIPNNHLYNCVKGFVERIASFLIDSTMIKQLMTLLDETIEGTCDSLDGIKNASESGIKLLLALSPVFPHCFRNDEVLEFLTNFIENEDDSISCSTLQIFWEIGKDLDTEFPSVFRDLEPILQRFAKAGTQKQAKFAIKCIERMSPNNKAKIYAPIFDHIEKSLNVETDSFLINVVAIGHISQICPNEFSDRARKIVVEIIVKELLMVDRNPPRASTKLWYEDHLVSNETLCKMEGMKMMVRWLQGRQSDKNSTCTSTLRLLFTVVKHSGDLMEKNNINKAEMARLRLQAGCCILKLAEERSYYELITNNYFQQIALLINDTSSEVRKIFAEKIYKGLISLKLPLAYMAIFCLGANEPIKEQKDILKSYLYNCIQKRRNYLRSKTSGTQAIVFQLLPDYVLPYAIHLLAHDRDFKDNDDIESLKDIKECLWFILDPLINRNDRYSSAFYRQMIEQIKSSKDAMNPDDEIANKKLYAVCDLATNLIFTKPTTVDIREFPAEPLLPNKLFLKPDVPTPNTTIYLPKEMQISAKSSGRRSTNKTEVKINGDDKPIESKNRKKNSLDKNENSLTENKTKKRSWEPEESVSNDEFESDDSETYTPRPTRSGRQKSKKDCPSSIDLNDNENNDDGIKNDNNLSNKSEEPKPKRRKPGPKPKKLVLDEKSDEILDKVIQPKKRRGRPAKNRVSQKDEDISNDEDAINNESFEENQKINNVENDEEVDYNNTKRKSNKTDENSAESKDEEEEEYDDNDIEESSAKKPKSKRGRRKQYKSPKLTKSFKNKNNTRNNELTKSQNNTSQKSSTSVDSSPTTTKRRGRPSIAKEKEKSKKSVKNLKEDLKRSVITTPTRKSSQESSQDSSLRMSNRRRQTTEKMGEYLRARAPSSSPIKSNNSSPVKISRSKKMNATKDSTSSSSSNVSPMKKRRTVSNQSPSNNKSKSSGKKKR